MTNEQLEQVREEVTRWIQAAELNLLRHYEAGSPILAEYTEGRVSAFRQVQKLLTIGGE